MELRGECARVGTRARRNILIVALVCLGLAGPSHADFGSEQAGGSGGAQGGSSASAEPFSQPGWMGSPAPQVGECLPAEEEIEVCGRKEKIIHQCAFPSITPEMHAEASGHPELADQHERVNTCVSEEKNCKAFDPKQGDTELVAELARIKAKLHEMPTKIKFHFSVTNTKLEKVRDDMAIVSKKGFVRDIVAQVVLYRLEDHQKFHHNAEGLDLVAMKAAEKERVELRKMEEVLQAMEKKFMARKDMHSAVNSSGFAMIARQREFEMEAVTCELKKMAAINNEREDRMKSLGMEIVGQLGQGTGAAQPLGEVKPPAGSSDVTGVGVDKKLADPGKSEKLDRPDEKPGEKLAEKATIAAGTKPAPAGTQLSTTGASQMPGFFTQQEFAETLSPFGENPDEIARRNQELRVAAPGSEEEESLFERLHRQYRGRERAGHFNHSVVD